MKEFDNTIKQSLDLRLKNLEEYFNSDVIFYLGEIHPAFQESYRNFIESLKETSNQTQLVIILNTTGGSAETVEKMVEITRYHYKVIYFVVPQYAMSAGTIFCMSGNKIFMDYASSLGPIDPQVFNGERYVPALGYLDQVEKLLEKARNRELTKEEFLILQNLDLAELSRYEQAKNLTVTLLKKWLVEYKFQDWTHHRTNPDRKGKPVTPQEKENRAEEIAKELGDNKKWHSHNRMIGIETLRELRLEIEDYSGNIKLRSLIRPYNDLIVEYINRNNLMVFMHSRNYF